MSFTENLIISHSSIISNVPITVRTELWHHTKTTNWNCNWLRLIMQQGCHGKGLVHTGTCLWLFGNGDILLIVLHFQKMINIMLSSTQVHVVRALNRVEEEVLPSQSRQSVQQKQQENRSLLTKTYSFKRMLSFRGSFRSRDSG